jgi:hypothetical protein
VCSIPSHRLSSDAVRIKLKIGAPRAHLFSSASVSARTRMYLVQGDEVVLLDRQGENEDWFLVQYRAPSGQM